MTKIQRFSLSRLEFIAFVDGFSLMVYELVAARLLAPYIGSSVYVWTSVIGVIIAALSLGYWAGGIAADKRNKASDVAWLLLLIAGGVTATLLLSETIISSIAATTTDARLQGLFASLVLFAPTSFLMGTISPYLVKLQLHNLTQTGKTVAAISAFNAVGGIVGTFLTGFFLFQILGSKASLVLITILLVATSWVIAQHTQTLERIAASILIVTISFAASTAPIQVVASIDTASAHYQINDVPHTFGPIRVLQTGPGGYQSGKDFTNPDALVFWYTQTMANVATNHHHNNKILVIGSGAFSLPQYLSLKLPHSTIDVVDVDEQLLPIAEKYFDYQKSPNIRFIAQDGRSFLNQTKTQYDVILVDAFSNTTIPFTLTTQEFGHAIHAALTPQGIVAMNVIAAEDRGACGKLLGGIQNSLEHPGSGKSEAIFSSPFDTKVRQNIIITHTKDSSKHVDQNVSSNRIVLTDNHAPIESLSFQCLQST